MKKIALSTIITLATLSSISGSTFAAWQELGSTTRMVVYVDLDTVKTMGEKVQVMSMLDFKKPGENPENKQAVSSIIGLNEYDCPAVSYRPIEFKEFAGNKGSGKVVSNTNTPDSKFEPVIDQSWTAGVFKSVCKLKKQ